MRDFNTKKEKFLWILSFVAAAGESESRVFYSRSRPPNPPNPSGPMAEGDEPAKRMKLARDTSAVADKEGSRAMAPGGASRSGPIQSIARRDTPRPRKHARTLQTTLSYFYNTECREACLFGCRGPLVSSRILFAASLVLEPRAARAFGGKGKGRGAIRVSGKEGASPIHALSVMQLSE